METSPTLRRRSWLPAAALSVLALVGAGFAFNQDAPAPEAGPAQAPTETQAPASKEPTAKPVSLPAGAGAQPRRVIVPSLGIDAPVVPIATNGTTLEPPADPQVLGWWSAGAPVGAARGSALITGHTVNAGDGAMNDLEQARRGAMIRVASSKGPQLYRVQSVQVLDKDAIAQQSTRLFSQRVPGRLVLVTCEDWDGTGYLSNVVVTATPAA